VPGDDAGYGTSEFLWEVESRGLAPHAAMPQGKIEGTSQRHEARRRMRRRMRTKGYRMSQRLRRMTEPVLGWCKDNCGLRRTRFIGRERIQDDALMVAAGWNLMRMVTPSGARDGAEGGISPVRRPDCGLAGTQRTELRAVGPRKTGHAEAMLRGLPGWRHQPCRP
jgi:hypothetical protein